MTPDSKGERRPWYPAWLPECCQECEWLLYYHPDPLGSAEYECNLKLWFPTRKRTCKRRRRFGPAKMALLNWAEDFMDKLQQAANHVQQLAQEWETIYEADHAPQP